MNVVFIVPTGIGAEIGGHAGDASPAANLIASVCDTLITHPNVYNASDINTMPDNCLYVEGSMLDQFLAGRIGLERVRSNRIAVAVNGPAKADTINAVSAARATLGIDAFIIELDTPLEMVAGFTDTGRALGEVRGVGALCEQVNKYQFDALAVATPIEVSTEIALNYFHNGGVNPWGGVEALASSQISSELKCPVAHAPVDTGVFDTFKEVADPRLSAEMVSIAYLYCVLKGLHKAPVIGTEVTRKDVDCVIVPNGCYGPPHREALKHNISVIVVRENRTIYPDHMPEKSEFIYVDSYLEAAGVVAAMRIGVSIGAVRRPLKPTQIIRSRAR